jgi:hypothetical protein
MTNYDRSLRTPTSAASFLPLATTKVNRLFALTAMLFVASAGFGQQAATATFLSDAQSSTQAPPSATTDGTASHRASAATHGTTDPPPKWGILGGYSSIETNNHNFHFNPNITLSGFDYDENGHGFNIGVVRNLNRYFGVVGLFDAHFSSNNFVAEVTPGKCPQPPCAKVAQGADLNPSLFRFTAGPELAFRNRTRVIPFADVLFGLAHSHATFSTAGSAGSFSGTEGENGFAMNAAVGVEVRVAHRLSFRGSIDYGKAFVGSSVLPSQQVDSIGFSSGLLFRFH